MQSDAEKPVIIVDTKGEGRSSAPLDFDRGYVTVTPELRFEVSRRIKEEFENGRDYYALHGRSVQRRMMYCGSRTDRR